MSYSIEIIHNQKFIWYKHSGNIERSEIGEVWRQLLGMKEFIELKYNLLSDYRGAKFNFSREETKFIEEFLKSIKHILSGKKESVIVTDPHAAAISMLFENKMNAEIGFMVKVFTTEKAALDWLKE